MRDQMVRRHTEWAALMRRVLYVLQTHRQETEAAETLLAESNEGNTHYITLTCPLRWMTGLLLM